MTRRSIPTFISSTMSPPAPDDRGYGHHPYCRDTEKRQGMKSKSWNTRNVPGRNRSSSVSFLCSPAYLSLQTPCLRLKASWFSWSPGDSRPWYHHLVERNCVLPYQGPSRGLLYRGIGIIIAGIIAFYLPLALWVVVILMILALWMFASAIILLCTGEKRLFGNF